MLDFCCVLSIECGINLYYLIINALAEHPFLYSLAGDQVTPSTNFYLSKEVLNHAKVDS
jgi:hypothetical protein